MSIEIADAEETPQSKHRKKMAKEYHEEKEQKAVVAEWYTLNNNKLVKHSKSAKGNVYRVYVGSLASCKEDILKLQSEGKIKPITYKP